jgi:phospholipase C
MTTARATLLSTLLTVIALPVSGAEPSGLERIKTVVVIYGENRSFDNLYGMFPGSNGVAQAIAADTFLQRDHDGSVLARLPPVWQKGNKPDPLFPEDLPNAPFRIDAPPVNLTLATATRDLTHRFYQNQMQINGGKNDGFAAISDAGALAMGYYDGSQLPLWKLAREYVLADNFFMAAFGGSYLNHMWLACACTPQFPGAPEKMKAQLDTGVKDTGVKDIDAKDVDAKDAGVKNADGKVADNKVADRGADGDGASGKLREKPDSPASALDGPPHFQDGALTPDGYTVNTVQPPYQPSGHAPAPGGDPALANPADNPLPPQTLPTIGDTLSARNVSWKWYAGGYNEALRERTQIYGGDVNFQPHHQPFNYFLRFAPGTPDRARHLKDGQDLLADIGNGTLPQVAFYKPQGTLNEHPGYANLMAGDVHIADLVAKLKASRQWKNMAIIITYDENGGFWDHAAPPKGDRWGPGSRVPAIIVSPYAKRGFIDHTAYDTTSILQFLTRRFRLEALPGMRTGLGDLINAFDFTPRKLK